MLILTDKERQILRLKEKGLTYEQIGKNVGIKGITVNRRMYIAHQKLKKYPNYIQLMKNDLDEFCKEN